MPIKARDLIIAPCEVAIVRDFIIENHYSKSINGVKITQCFSVMHENILVGGVLFGGMATTAWKKFGTDESHVLELRRLVLLDAAGRNSESRVVGFCLRWIKKNIPSVRVIVSYADPKYGHSGIIYRASNFKHVGMSGKDKGYFDPTTGKTHHSRALRTKYKGDYKPFVKVLRDKLKNGVLIAVELPPKHCYLYEFTRKDKP